jgi:aspartate/methionine/tyrosine aminotransferase
MKIEQFVLERTQSLHENTVELNLSESGVHPYDLRTLLTPAQIEELCGLELGYGWTNGAVELRDAIAALHNGRSRENVLVTNGSAEANFVLVMSLLEPGDELIIVVPNYLQIVGWARAVGVTVRTVPLDERNGWAPDLDAIRRSITPRTRMISLCNPNNPTGAVLGEAAMRALVELAAEHDLYLHADEIYKGSDLAGEEGPSFGDLYSKAFVTNGLSKAMAMPGLRIGWLLGPAAEIEAAWHCKDYTSITTGTISEYVARHVLKPDVRRRVLDRSKHILRENLALLDTWVRGQGGSFSYVPPRAGGMAFLKYALKINSTELLERLRVEKGVFPVAGDAFGMDGYIRIGIGVPRERLAEGLRRIGEFVKENPGLRGA